MSQQSSMEFLTNIKVDSEQYSKEEPFPHVVIDNFWPKKQLDDAVNQLTSMPESVWTQNIDPTSNDCTVQRKKCALNQPEMLGDHAPALQDIMRQMNSPEMLTWLEKLTGITDLQIDESNVGGGIHRSLRGGKLSVHADFNIHPSTGKHRRINALLYLNKDWEREYEGCLELWRDDMSECVKTIEPIFNRLVVFNTTDDALHGHPVKLECPEDRCRLSLAFYYYTDDRPENEKAPAHMALWQKRPVLGY